MSEQFNISADYFAACGGFASKQETRYYLSGVYVEPAPAGGVLMVATDGHRMAIFYDRAGVAEKPAILSIANWKSPDLKKARSETKPRRLSVDGDVGAVLSYFMKDREETVAYLKVNQIDGTYPDYKRVFPKASQSATAIHDAAWNPDFLLSCRNAVNRAGHDARVIQLFQASASEPAWVSVAGFEDGRFVVMPARPGYTKPPAMPEWLTPTALAAE